MHHNLRRFLIKAALLVLVVFAVRAAFQAPIEFFRLEMFRQTSDNRLFSKIDALKVIGLIAVFFGLYFRERISRLQHPKVKPAQTALFFIAGTVLVAAYYLGRLATNAFTLGDTALVLLQAGMLACLAISFLDFAACVFQASYMREFAREFKKELPLALLAAVVVYALLMIFQSQWLLFSGSVSIILKHALGLFYDTTLAYSGSGRPIIQAEGFSVAIDSPCSGIDSLFLFSAFFAGIYALDRHLIMKGRFAAWLAAGLVGVYLINALRLFLLIVAGIHISPEFAVGLFHTHAGWLLFVAYFIFYYYMMKKFIYKPIIHK
jgi:exosortase/archaeosortase family protein